MVYGCHISAKTFSAYACMVASTSSVGHNQGHGRHCFRDGRLAFIDFQEAPERLVTEPSVAK